MRNGNVRLDLATVLDDPVLTVPMRNGNNLMSNLQVIKTSVLTVPMRNGNVRLKTVIGT